MEGPYPLQVTEINRRADDLRPGIYALGSYEQGVFRVKRIGRFSANMSGNLYRWLGLYSRFRFKIVPDTRAAFIEECSLWHECGGEEGLLDNPAHPSSGPGQLLACPVCGLPV